MGEDASEILSRIDPQRIADLSLELVEILSPTGQELEIAKFYRSQLEKIGLEVCLDYVEQNRPNVIATLRGKGGGKSLILGGHMDTVPQEGGVPPRSDAGRVYGREACDMKGSLAAMAECGRALVASNVRLSGDVILIGWVGHEAPAGRGVGPMAVARSIRGQDESTWSCDHGGTHGQCWNRAGGMAIFTIITSSPKGSFHTATVSLRSNPILWISEVIREIHVFDEELNSTPWNPLIAQRPSVQLGIVTGGDFYNRLPKECRLTGTVRWDPGEDVRIVEKKLPNRLDKLENRLSHSLDKDARLKLEMDLVRESYQIASDSEIVRSTQAAVREVTGKDVGVSGWRAVGDPPILNEAGVPTVFYGPFDFTNMTAHSDNEWISVESLTTSSRVYAALALRYCI